jgi:hypothetical protein
VGVAASYPSFGRWGVAALAIAVLLPAGELLRQRVAPTAGTERILNPATAPLTMEGEGGGPHSPFFPSASTTNAGGLIPSEFFLDSKACACGLRAYAYAHDLGFRDCVENLSRVVSIRLRRKPSPIA